MLYRTFETLEQKWPALVFVSDGVLFQMPQQLLQEL